MSFSRAKINRFNDTKSCAPPPGAYDPKFEIRFKGSSTMDKCDRFSSTESLDSCAPSSTTGSNGVTFRTPKPLQKTMKPITKGCSSSASKVKLNFTGSLTNNTNHGDDLKKKRVEELEKTVSDLKAKLKESKQQNEELINIKEEMNGIKEELSRTQEELEKTKQEMKESQEEMLKKIKEKDTEINRLFNEHADMVQTNQKNLQALVEKEHEIVVIKNDLERNLEEQELQLAEFQASKANIESDLTKATAREQKLERDLCEMKLNYVESTRDACDLRQSKENLQSELADLVQSKTELEVRKANLEVCFRNVSLDLASMRGSRERLEQINEALEADLSGAKTRAFDANEKQTDLQARLTRAETDAANSQLDLDMKQQLVDLLQDNIKASQAERDQLASKVKDLQRDLDAERQVLSALREKMQQDMENSANTLKPSAEKNSQTELALKTSNKNLFAAIQAINQRLYASDTEVERLKAEQKCFEDIIQEVSSTFSKFQVHTVEKALHGNVEKLKQHHRQQLNMMMDSSEHQELKKQLQEFKQQILQFNSKMERLDRVENELEARKEQLTHTQSKLTRVQVYLEQLERYNEELRSERTSLIKELDRERERCNQFEQQVKEKNGENKNTKFSQSQLNEIIQENEKLTEQVRHLKKTNEILKQEQVRTSKVCKKDKENALSPVSRVVSRSPARSPLAIRQ